jgi:hypothetical protein
VEKRWEKVGVLEKNSGLKIVALTTGGNQFLQLPTRKYKLRKSTLVSHLALCLVV